MYTYPNSDVARNTLIIAQMAEDSEGLCEAELEVLALLELVVELRWLRERASGLARTRAQRKFLVLDFLLQDGLLGVVISVGRYRSHCGWVGGWIDERWGR